MAYTSHAARNVRSRKEMHGAARGEEVRGGSILLQPFFVELCAELLPARDLARLCAVSRRHRDHAAALALAATRAHHGVSLLEASLANMHSMDCVRTRDSDNRLARARGTDGSEGQRARHYVCRVS